MQYDHELQALRKELDDLLNSASRMKGKIDAIERQLRIQSITKENAKQHSPAASEPLDAESPATPAVPPPLPPITPGAPVNEPIGAPAPTFASTHEEPVFPKSAARAVSPAAPAVSIEQRIGKYWLPRGGGVILAIGVVWALYYVGPMAPPIARIGFGYLVAGIAIFAAWWLEKKYLQYARVLLAAGIGISYFVTFAAHYIGASRVIASETAGIGALVAVVVLWGAVAQIRRSHVIATLVTLLGHLTISLAFFTGGDLARLSVVGIAILGFGSAFFLLMNRWYYVAAVGMVGCYINHALWFWKLAGTTDQADFNLTFGFLCVYMLTFALAELLCPEDLRRSLVPTKYRVLFVSTNSTLFFLLGTVAFYTYDHMLEHRDVVLATYALVLGLIGLGYLRLRKGDPLYNVYLTKAVSIFSLALAVRYGQGTLTASLSIQAVALLWSARRSGLVVTRMLAFAVAVLCILQALYAWTVVWSVKYDDPLHTRRVVEAGFAVAGLFIASQLYQRTDWTRRSPATLPFHNSVLGLLWDLDVIAEPPANRVNRAKPLGGLLFPHLYALGGLFLFCLYSMILLTNAHRGGVFAAFVLAATIIGFALQARPFSLVAMLALLPTAIGSVVSNVMGESAPIWLVWATISMVMAASIVGDRRIVGAREGLAFHQMAPSPHLLYCTTAFILAIALLARTDSGLIASPYLAIAAAAAAVLTKVLNARALATSSLILLGFAGIGWFVHALDPATTRWHTVMWMGVAASIFVDRFYAQRAAREILAPWGATALVIGWLIVMRYVDVLGKDASWLANPVEGFGYYTEDWRPFAGALVSFAYAGYAAFTRSRTAVAVAGIGALFASAEMVYGSYAQDFSMAALLCGYIALAVFWAICERLIARIKTESFQQAVGPLSGVAVALASGLLVLMVERIPTLQQYFLTVGWGILAVVLFGVSLLTRQKFYRFAGLGVFLLAILRLFKDAYELTGVYRPLAFIGLAVLMLAVSFGYFYASRLLDNREPESMPPAVPDNQDNPR